MQPAFSRPISPVRPAFQRPRSAALARASFLIVPILWLLLYFWQKSWTGPAWLAANQDPNYAYLFNGLGLACGHWPTFCDNPGSPVFLFIAGLLRCLHPLAAPDTLAATVLARPEFYLSLANANLAVLFAIVLAWSGARVAKATGNGPAGIVYQLLPLLTSQGTDALQGVRPEPVMLISGVALGALIVAQSFDSGLPWKRAWAFGMLLGIGMTAKVFFAAMLLPVLAVAPDWPSRAKAAFTTVVGTALVTIPVWPSLGHFAGFLWATLTHTGSYGEGARGLPSFGAYLQNLELLLRMDKSFGLLLGCILVASFFAAKMHRRWLWALLGAQGLSFLVIALHPGGRYLTASLSLMGAAGTAILLPWLNRGKRGWVALLLLPLVAYKGLNLTHNRQLARAAEEERIRLAKVIRRDYPGHLAVPYFQCSDPGFALYYGNITVQSRFTPAVAGAIADRLVYNRFDQEFHRCDRLVSARELAGAKLLMRGWTLSDEDRRIIETKHRLKMTSVFHGWIESVYQVEWPGN